MQSVIDFFKRSLASKEQLTHMIAIILGVLTTFHIMPAVVPLLGQLSQQIQSGDTTAIVGTLLAILISFTGMFRRDKLNKDSAA